MRFRPCIDLKDGKVVQIVGGSLDEGNAAGLETNFVSDRQPADYAGLYHQHGLTGGHIIALGPGNREAALEALQAWPGGMQYGGGVTPDNATDFLEAGASHVIVTSWVFRDGHIDMQRLHELKAVTGPDRLVLDLSCRRAGDDYWVVTDRWQTFTREKVDATLLDSLAEHCDEFLVHGVDVEGRMQGIEEPLIERLGAHSPIPVTYAGGVRHFDDLERVRELGLGRVDLTIGSALDIFGGTVSFERVVDWQRGGKPESAVE